MLPRGRLIVVHMMPLNYLIIVVVIIYIYIYIYIYILCLKFSKIFFKKMSTEEI